MAVVLPLHGAAMAYRDRLLADLGMAGGTVSKNEDTAPSDRWCSSGLADLTGFPGQALRDSPLPIADYADAVLAAIRALSGRHILPAYGGAELLTHRAAMVGLARQGDISPGGSCHILACRDGHLALNLARDSDSELLHAWLGEDIPRTWPSVEEAVRGRSLMQLLEQGRLLGLALTDARSRPTADADWYRQVYHGLPREPVERAPRVLDLSALWAGPLCGKIFLELGAEVFKVESSHRPDGGRAGSAAFFEFLNGGKQDVTLDLRHTDGIAALRELITTADIVIEAARPRGLRQLGIVAEEHIDANPGLTWLSITGYGRDEPEANWIAYGDDAGVAGGLSWLIYRATGRWMFCGDAIADPLTGLHAALAGYAAWRAGGGVLLSLSLVDTIRFIVATAHKAGTPCHS